MNDDPLANWQYRILLRLSRHFRLRDLLGGVLIVLAVILAALGKDPKLAIPILVAYFLVAGGRAWLTIRARQTRFAVQGYVIGGLFQFINRELFSDSNRTRFTLFREAPLRPSYIVPWWRFQRGGRGPIRDAEDSRARYKKSEGITGSAWANPAKELLVQVLPYFPSRAHMEAYYIGNLGVPRETVGTISDYMIGVRAIVSYAFLDSREDFIGLLSLDIRDADVNVKSYEGTDEIGIIPQEGEPITVDADNLFLLTRAVGNVLESFQTVERRTTAYE